MLFWFRATHAPRQLAFPLTVLAVLAVAHPAAAEQADPEDPVHAEGTPMTSRLWTFGAFTEFSSPNFQQLGFSGLFGRTTRTKLFNAAQGYSGLRVTYSLGPSDVEDSAALTIAAEGGADIPLSVGSSSFLAVRPGLLLGVTFTPSALYGRLWLVSPGASLVYQLGPVFLMGDFRLPVFFGVTSRVGFSAGAGLGLRI